MIDSEKFLKYLKSKGYEIDKKKIDKLISRLDRDKISETQAKRFRYEIWDKKSPINNVSAEDIINSRNYKIVSAYLIYVDEQLVYFQDHNPTKEGYVSMTKKEAEQIAQDFINKKIEESVDGIIVNYIIQQLSSNA